MNYTVGNVSLPALPEPLSGEHCYHCEIDSFSLQVREDKYWRWLLFQSDQIDEACGSTPIQSLMYRSDPSRLIPAYMQVMCSGLAFLGDARGEILQLGLGGGAINRFLLQQLKIKNLVTVERHRAIIDIYRQYFSADPAEKSESVIEETADHFLQYYEGQAFDYIIIDLFDQRGLPDYCYTSEFYQSLRAKLENHGMLAINIPFWKQETLQKLFIALRKHFPVVSFAEIPEHQNLVLFASQSKLVADKKYLRKLDDLLDINAFDCLTNLVGA